MKVSELVKEIIEEVEAKFNAGDCYDRAINVGMYWSGEDWQVWIERPSKEALDRGKIPYDKWSTVRLVETECMFYCICETLTEALKELRQKIDDAEDWDE